MTDLSDKIALVTGGSRGIGRAICVALGRQNARVVINYAGNEAAAHETAKLVSEAGGPDPVVMQFDVSDSEAVDEAFKKVKADLGGLHILVNNAGITRDNLSLRMSDEEFDEVIRVNLRSVFIACRAAARPMMKGRFGRLVNIGSTSGVVGNSGQTNYCAAKAGLIGMTKAFARELGSKGVTGNVVAPGFIQTDMTANLPEDATKKFMDALSIRRLGVVEDIASAVAYVSSDDAGYLTGQTICVDGGLTMC